VKVPFTAGDDDAGRRLETVARRLLPALTLSAVHKALRGGDIRLNGAKTSADARVASGDVISVWDALVGDAPPAPPSPAVPLPPEWVLHIADDLVVLNKPSGLATHRGSAREDALDERVRAWLPASGLAFRPGPLHRLDRETSGVIVFSRTLEGARSFSQALREHAVSKTYLAVLSGVLPHRHRSSAPIEGRDADTLFVPLAWTDSLTLARVELGTGRTHQIRVHAQQAGHPLAGDRKYGGGPTPAGLDAPFLLHAWKLECSLLPPLTAPLPTVRADWLEKKFKFRS